MSVYANVHLHDKVVVDIRRHEPDENNSAEFFRVRIADGDLPGDLHLFCDRLALHKIAAALSAAASEHPVAEQTPAEAVEFAAASDVEVDL